MDAAAPEPQVTTRWLGLAGLAIGVFMFTLDASIVNVALPTLVRTLDTSFATVQWIVLSYLLMATALVLTAARWGEIWGKKRAYMGGLAVFILGSVLCGLAPDIGWLIAFRAVQGLGAVFVSALGAAIVGEMFPPRERGRAMGIIGSAVLLGVALGPSLGGLVIAVSSWRWMFYINLPIGLAALLVLSRYVPDIAPRAPAHAFDWPGNLLAALMLCTFPLALTWGQSDGFARAHVLALLFVSLLALVTFLWVEARSPGPLLDLNVFRNRVFANGLTMSGIMFLVLTGTGFLMPFYLEVVARFSPAKVGMLLAISPIAGGVIAPLGGLLSDRIGARFVTICGLALIAIGLSLFTWIGETVSIVGFAACVIPIGIGMGMFQAANDSNVLNAVAPERLGLASALLSLMRTLGQTAGVPLLATIFSIAAWGSAGRASGQALLAQPPAALLHATHVAFATAAAIVVCAIVAATRRQTSQT
jgi:EmrB/QacA subfamily drug resistance transporter